MQQVFCRMVRGRPKRAAISFHEKLDQIRRDALSIPSHNRSMAKYRKTRNPFARIMLEQIHGSQRRRAALIETRMLAKERIRRSVIESSSSAADLDVDV